MEWVFLWVLEIAFFILSEKYVEKRLVFVGSRSQAEKSQVVIKNYVMKFQKNKVL